MLMSEKIETYDGQFEDLGGFEEVGQCLFWEAVNDYIKLNTWISCQFHHQDDNGPWRELKKKKKRNIQLEGLLLRS